MLDSINIISRWCMRIVFGIFLILLISKQNTTTYANTGFLIANSAIPVKQLSKNEIVDLYLGKTIIWNNGETVIITCLHESDSHAKFLREYIKKSPRQFYNYWKRQLFMGRTHTMPKSFNDEESLIRFVSETKGAIGYVSSFNPSENVKAISIK